MTREGARRAQEAFLDAQGGLAAARGNADILLEGRAGGRPPLTSGQKLADRAQQIAKLPGGEEESKRLQGLAARALSLENFGRNAGGEVGDMLKAQERQANADIWGKLNDALPTATDAAAAERAVDNLSQQRLKDMKLGAPLDAGGATGSLLDEMIRKSVGKVRDALESARGSFDDAVTISNADGTPEAVHSWRKGINDSINAARARGESGLASELDNKLRDIKTALDRELGARVTHPGAQPGADVWNPFLRDFYAAKTKARQAGEGVDLRTKFESRARDSAGTPLPSSMAGDLRTLQAKAKNNQLVDRFDNPLLADDVQRALNVAERDVWLQGLSRSADVVGRGSGTANYLRQGQEVFKQAAAPESTALGWGLAGGVVGGPGTAVGAAGAALVKNWMAENRNATSRQAAKSLMQMLTDPRQAGVALEQALKDGANPKFVESVRKALLAAGNDPLLAAALATLAPRDR